MIADTFRRLPLLLLAATVLSAPAKDYYTRDAVFAYRPSAKSSKHTISRFGPVGMSIELHQPAFTMKVGKVEKGSPAEAAGLKSGMFIDSVNGESLADIDPRIQLGNMITQAEAKGGVVKFMIRDNKDAAPRPVVVQISALGAYSPTSPLDCAKSDQIVRDLADYLAARPYDGGNIGRGGSELLFLLSTGEEKDLEVVRQRMKKWVASWEKGSAPNYAWDLGYGGIPLAEYYLRTGDKDVLPIIQAYVDSACKYYYGGGWGGRTYGGYTYGQMNAAGTHVTTFLLLAKECGINGHEKIMEQALKQQFRFSGRGCTPYGDHLPNPAFIDNGKAAVLAFTMAAAASLTPEGEDSIYAQARDMCASKGFYSSSYMNVGHTGGGIGEVWRGAAIGLLPEVRPAQFQQLVDVRSYFYDISRRYNGSFGIVGGGGYDKNDNFPTPIMGMAYTVPRKTLQITGAPESPHSHHYALPKRIWGTAADDAFQSLDPIAGASGNTPDLAKEDFYADAAAPAMSRMGVPKNSYSHSLPKPKSPPTAKTYDYYAHHPEYGLRHYVAQRIQQDGHDDLIVQYLHADDARLRAVGCQAIVWNGKGTLPAERLTDGMVDALLGMINDDEESWWVIQSALQALQLAPADKLAPHVDQLLEWAKHEEWWIQSAAMTALGPLADHPQLAEKIFKTVGFVAATNRRNNPVGPIADLSRIVANGPPAARQAAITHLADAYANYPVEGGARDDVPHPVGEEELVSKLAANLAVIPGGLDALYRVSTKRYPDDTLPHKQLFLAKADYSADPITRKALEPTIRNELIPEYIGRNREKLLEALAMTEQSTTPGKGRSYLGGEEMLDGLAGLYRKMDNHDYDWRIFADLRQEKWWYHSFDPIPSEQVKFDLLITRYRDVTFPEGMENWFASDFDPQAAGWKQGRGPFGNYNGELLTGPLPKCGPHCTNSVCYGATPCNTLWEKELLLLRGTFDLPAVKEGHRYRLRVNEGEHVGQGGGYKVYINGKELVEQTKCSGRGSGESAKGGFITRDFLPEFDGSPVTIAVKSFIRYNDRYKAKPTTKVPQGRMSIHIEEMKMPPIDWKEIKQSAAIVPMTSWEWQQNPTNDTLFAWSGKFENDPAIAGSWEVLTEVKEIEEFNPEKPGRPRRPPFDAIQFLPEARTDKLLWAWSGRHLMNLGDNQALRIQPKTVEGTEYLFVERGGFSERNKPDWKPTWFVLKRPAS